MSRRKGSFPNRKQDEDFNRNGKLLTSRDGSTVSSSERQLFNPRSDNPIAFNKAATNTTEEQQVERKIVQAHTPPPTSNIGRRPTPASDRRLWSANDSSPASNTPSPKPSPKLTIIERSKPVKPDKPKAKLIRKKAPGDKPKSTIVTPLTEEEQQKEIQRKKWKSLIASIRSIESDLEQLSSTSRTLSCFDDNENKDLSDTNRRAIDQLIDVQDTILVEQDVLDAEKIWKQKVELHLSLGEKYLEILNCDLAYAEKKGLETLCWKRAVYSLVDQFRRALKKSAAATTQAASVAAAAAAPVAPKHSELAALLLEEDIDTSVTEIPVIHESGAMTFIKVEKEKEEAKQDDQLLLKQTRMILAHFLKYLDLAENLYQKLTLFLKSVDDDEDSEMDNYLNQWRRTRKYKWYTCIPLRGDLARYRWSYTPDNEILEESEVDYDNMAAPVTLWTKDDAFQEAWKRYFLGVWLMPAKGNLYFNLSLLLQHPTIIPGYEFHKLYFSLRSLMVRRNGFLNARESMLVLFEGNRRWIQKHLEVNAAKQRTRRGKINNPVNGSTLSDKDASIPALFIRLHGMLFTKIGLDEFPQIKRLFFDALFEKTPQTNQVEQGPEKSTAALKKEENFSSSNFFWFETIILCLSSLYTYDYANSKLTKLISNHTINIFYPNTLDEPQQAQYQTLMDDLSENILFTYEIDLTCQIAVELFQRYLDPLLLSPKVPTLPVLPYVSLTFKDNKEFLFGAVQDFDTGKRITNQQHDDTATDSDDQAWLVYIEILLHWMVLNGICIRSRDRISLWESLVGDIGYDLMSKQGKRFNVNDNTNHNQFSKISSAFWPLLLQFLNKLLGELAEEDKYDMVNKHLMENEEEEVKSGDDKFSGAELSFAKNISAILGQAPSLPEEDYLRGLGWVDEIHGRFLKLEPQIKATSTTNSKFDTVMKRKIKILEYGFTLVKHLDDILYYDPVEEIFTISKSIEERALAIEQANKSANNENDACNSHDEDTEGSTTPPVTIGEIEDDVLLSFETEYAEENEGDDIMTQLKKRREQLQSIVASAEQEERYGYRRLPARAKEREARLSYLRECIIPGKTILVLDTNCFIGHIDLVKKLLDAKKWSIIVPLVVVTELDGLRTNPHRLGLVAQQGIQLLESTLAAKPKQSTTLRIQTSHNNFMNDISIRSEQFVFGESDKNLDDLILSSCLWWVSQHKVTDDKKTVPVCLVTGDRNLSVKARARDVEVVPVSAIIQLTPKEQD